MMATLDEVQIQNAKAQMLNERTYQEVEYLKKNLGPILVAALAEVCIRRPADPIEYLGHWLLRWRYNEELKRRDVLNALEVVRQKAFPKDDENSASNPNAPDQPPGPQAFTQGFVPGSPFGPPGFGGPLDASQVDHLGDEGAEEEEQLEGEDEQAEGEEGEGEAETPAGEPGTDEKRASVAGTEKRDSASKEKKPSQVAEGEGGEKRASQDDTGEHRGSASGSQKRSSTEKKMSTDAAAMGDGVQEKRKSGGSEKRASVDSKQILMETPQEDAPAEVPVVEETEEAEPAPPEA